MTKGSHSFLGQEFLTWLWFQTETQGGEFTISRDRQVGVSLDDLLVFEPRDDTGTTQQLKGCIPSRTHAARLALRQGHRLAKAQLTLAMDCRTWTVTVEGGSLVMGSIKLPEDDAESNSHGEKTEERADNYLDLDAILTELYGQFLEARLAPEYLEVEAKDQAAWMAGEGV